jgi:hypothetical protein
MSEEKDRGKQFDDSSNSNDNEDNNQNDDDRDNANKAKVEGSIWEVESDEEKNGMNKEALMGISTKMTNHKMIMMPVTMMKRKVTPT